MDRYFEDVLERLEFLHAEIERAIGGLSVAALDWMPAPGANAIGALVVHLTGAERYWIGTVIGGAPSDRDRESEFFVSGVTAAELGQRLAATVPFEREALGGLGGADLTRLCRVPRDGRTVTIGWALTHVVEHTAVHVGHIQLTRQLWDQGVQDANP